MISLKLSFVSMLGITFNWFCSETNTLKSTENKRSPGGESGHCKKKNGPGKRDRLLSYCKLY